MIQAVTQLGAQFIHLAQRSGRSFLFLLRAITARTRPGPLCHRTILQIYHVGVLSLVIVVISGLFIGMVVALQGYNTLQKFGAAQELGQLIALSVVRELGPVVTALLFAGRAGSALTAEIGLMRATEQLDCMEMMAVDPLARVIAPRFWAGLIALPLLTVMFNIVAIYGGHMVGVDWLGVDAGSFWGNMQASVDFREDVVNGIIKSIAFGFVITWIAVYHGFYCLGNAAGISRATTKTVVYGSLFVLGLDFVLTSLMMGGW
jgi:phospholipid/cholesterol/gamma-HCH transport system permease protein